MTYPGTLFLTRSEVDCLLPFEEYVPVVEHAFRHVRTVGMHNADGQLGHRRQAGYRSGSSAAAERRLRDLHPFPPGIRAGQGDPQRYGQSIAEQKVGRESTDEITIYDSTGTALQDVAAAVAIYQAAMSTGRGTMLSMAS